MRRRTHNNEYTFLEVVGIVKSERYESFLSHIYEAIDQPLSSSFLNQSASAALLFPMMTLKKRNQWNEDKMESRELFTLLKKWFTWIGEIDSEGRGNNPSVRTVLNN